jgi:hypothetical protein
MRVREFAGAHNCACVRLHLPAVARAIRANRLSQQPFSVNELVSQAFPVNMAVSKQSEGVDHAEAQR